MRLGALEAGGTKMVCATGDETGHIEERAVFPTKTPAETVPQMIDFFRERAVEALGIASFGPVDPDPASPAFGHILHTPKIAWRGYDLAGVFRKALAVPVGFDTDVNGSLLGEVHFGCAKGISNAVYYTIGTGIGAGILAEGHLLHGMQHPEAGHVLLRREEDDTFEGCCPSHGACFEGLASGVAIEKRWGRPAVELSDRPEVWDLESRYIAQALVGTICLLSPRIIILGGGVMEQAQLFPLIRGKVTQLLNGYLDTKELSDMEHYIVPAACRGDQGILGCLILAGQTVNKG
ncbi:MAG: ROK family protein [Lachnospiraceae bacterium]|nr:ROK family protein [Lachnospiraceae bacterium]